MAEEVSINKDKFELNISNLRKAVFNINSRIAAGREFEATNLEPFLDDLETTIDAIKLLERYKQMLDADIKILDSVGEKMVENDEQIAQSTGS
ncbi:TIGR04197 family type VII secretion effector [Oceanobacillus locisalsi]|uniref:TIGR04197 family type VII secretion effector n=1 Tax=Oceanobacillus locisalsi TaxID=546107 RepID=A0ABW3NJD2_9BACI